MTRFHAHFAISFFLIFCFAGFGTDNLTYAADQSSNSGEGASRSSKRKIRITRRGRSSSSKLTLPQIRAALKKDAVANASLYYRAGFLEEQQGNFFQALRDYSDAVHKKARVADALYRAGVVWEKIGEFYHCHFCLLEGDDYFLRHSIIGEPEDDWSDSYSNPEGGI